MQISYDVSSDFCWIRLRRVDLVMLNLYTSMISSLWNVLWVDPSFKSLSYEETHGFSHPFWNTFWNPKKNVKTKKKNTKPLAQRSGKVERWKLTCEFHGDRSPPRHLWSWTCYLVLPHRCRGHLLWHAPQNPPSENDTTRVVKSTLNADQWGFSKQNDCHFIAESRHRGISYRIFGHFSAAFVFFRLSWLQALLFHQELELYAGSQRAIPCGMILWPSKV